LVVCGGAVRRAIPTIAACALSQAGRQARTRPCGLTRPPPSTTPTRQTHPQYYSLDVTFFKSGLDAHLLDLLWSKYWVNTLAASPLIANREFAAGQISDVAEKLEQVQRPSVCMLVGAAARVHTALFTLL
jgi:hypothetical protein